jgi:hypothetical protein
MVLSRRALAGPLHDVSLMLPKEHGAYGQAAFPLVTSLAVVGLHPAPLALAVAVIALFLVHEPLVVLLGQRGRRASDLLAARAWIWLHVSLAVATIAGILAIDATPAPLRWTYLVPLVPAVALFATTLRNREKSAFGETGAALAFAAAAVPLCAAGGRPAAGIAIALAFSVLFVASTLAVRVVILRTRGGGNPQAVRVTRGATFAVAATGAVAALAAVSAGVLPWGAVAASVPGVAFAGGLAARPPAATRLRKVGWTLVAMSALTAFLLIAAA